MKTQHRMGKNQGKVSNKRTNFLQKGKGGKKNCIGKRPAFRNTLLAAVFTLISKTSQLERPRVL